MYLYSCGASTVVARNACTVEEEEKSNNDLKMNTANRYMAQKLRTTHNAHKFR